VLDALARLLKRQRERGRTPAADPVRGLVIEEGEAEGLLAELAADLGRRAGSGERGAAAGTQLRQEIADRARVGEGQGAFLPLCHAARAFELGDVEYDALLLALAVEVDARFGRVIAYLNDHVSRTRPTIGLACALAPAGQEPTLRPVDFEERPILRDGLLDVEGDGPLPGLALKVPRALIARLTGAAGRDDEPGLTLHAPQPDLVDRLVLAEGVREAIATWGEALRAQQAVPPLLVQGPPGSGRATAACAGAFVAGLPVVEVEVSSDRPERLRAAMREARWHGAAVLVTALSGPQPLDWAGLWSAGARRVLLIAVTPEDAAGACASAPVQPAVIRLDPPDVGRRQLLWRSQLARRATLSERETAELAGRFRFGPDRIARAVRRAAADAALRPPAARALDFDALAAAARAVDGAALGPLAQKMTLPFERADLIVPPAVDRELDLATAWVRHRHQVLHEWGFLGRLPMGHGLTALFTGPPGTGKTMAAQVMARALGLDLYRIDLSQVMSKFIGETEKQLALLFDARVGILFFDEAEAILGKRSEVKNAHDRYANIEIGYLLQRMEEYDGVTILATNRQRDMDEALVRRLHVVVDFPLPSAADRLRIWEGMLPRQAARAADVDLGALARGSELSGGEIKNAALAAAYLAAAEGTPIGMAHLTRAVHRELVKSGKVVSG
jgi:ATPase family protein associated with various cellular activities (AAA)/winged helix domain-containing protein